MSPSPHNTNPDHSTWLVRLVLALLGSMVLLGVFSMYIHPDFVVDLANQLWSCF